MNKTLRKIFGLGAVGLAGLLPTAKAEAQLPFFNGQRTPTTYAFENRAMIGDKDQNPRFTNISILKNFRRDIPLWLYMGNSYNNRDGVGNFFYGAGPIINLRNRLYMLPTIEGSGERFTGATVYSTLALGRGFHIDLDPKLDSTLNYDFTSFNIGKTYGGLTFGISSDIKDGRFRSLRDTDFRVARVRRGNFIDIGVNPNKRRLRIAFQKAF